MRNREHAGVIAAGFACAEKTYTYINILHIYRCTTASVRYTSTRDRSLFLKSDIEVDV